MMEEEVDGVTLLPLEVWDLILAFSSRKDRITASRVCHTWRVLALAKGINLLRLIFYSNWDSCISLLDKGLIIAFGNAAFGQLGRPQGATGVGLARHMESKVVVQVAAGDSFTIALTGMISGRLYFFNRVSALIRSRACVDVRQNAGNA